jgi:L-threonylcarbamoyladenylate synthase
MLVANIESLQQYTPTLSDAQVSEIESAQNTTWLVPAHATAPKWIIGQHASIAIRITHHPIAQQLCAPEHAIVSTSANISAYKTLKSRQEIWGWFGPHVDYVMIDAVGSGKPSEIRDLLSGKKLR